MTVYRVPYGCIVHYCLSLLFGFIYYIGESVNDHIILVIVKIFRTSFSFLLPFVWPASIWLYAVVKEFRDTVWPSHFRSTAPFICLPKQYHLGQHLKIAAEICIIQKQLLCLQHHFIIFLLPFLKSPVKTIQSI